MKNFLCMLLVAVFLTTTLTSCGGGGSVDTVSNEEKSEEISEKEPAEQASVADTGGEEKNPADMKLYYVSKLLGSQYWAIVEQGVKDACKDLGITNITIVGTAQDSEVEKQIDLLQNAVSAQPDAILVAPTDSKAMGNPVADVHNAGTPIVCIDTIAETEDYSAALLTNNYEAGKLCAETLIARLKAAGISEDKEGQVAMQVSSTGSQTVMDRVNGFNEYWEANAPKKWIVLNDDIKVNDGDITKAIGFTQDFLITYPNLIALFAPNNGSTVGFATGLKESGRDDLVLLGFDFSTEIAELIKNTDLNVSTVLQRQYMMGYDAVKAALDLWQGKEVEKTIDTGVIVVNKENLNDKEVQEVINAGS